MSTQLHRKPYATATTVGAYRYDHFAYFGMVSSEVEIAKPPREALSLASTSIVAAIAKVMHNKPARARVLRDLGCHGFEATPG